MFLIRINSTWRRVKKILIKMYQDLLAITLTLASV